MDDPSILLSLSPILLPALLLCSAFFSSAETAVFSLSAWEVHRLRERPTGLNRPILEFIENPRRLLVTSLIGNTFVNIAFATLFTSLCLVVIHDRLGGSTSTALSAATVGSTALLLLFGEIAPKTYAIRYAHRVARMVAPLLWAFSWVLMPVRWLIRLLVDAALRLVGAREMEAVGTVTQEEIRQIVRTGEQTGALSPTEGRVIERILELREMLAKDIMVPRTEMVAVPISTTLGEALQTARSAGHSRLPVYQDSLDQIVAILVVKAFPQVRRIPGVLEQSLAELMDRLQGTPAENTLLRRPLLVPETRRLDLLLRDFSEEGLPMAILLDEYGGTSGLVTVEDVLETLVGQIIDEYDERDVLDLASEWDPETLQRGVRLPARMSLRLVRRLVGVPMETQDADTIGGYVYSLFGRVPRPGETVHDPYGLEFTVVRMSGSRIQEVLLRRPRSEGEEENE